MPADKPIITIPLVPLNGQSDAVALFYGEQVIITDVPSFFWPTLALCSGHLYRQDIIKLMQKNGYIDADVGHLLDELEEMGIIVDSREVHHRLTQLTENPPFFPSEMTESDVLQHLASPRLPPAIGVSYQLPDVTPVFKWYRTATARRSCRSFDGTALEPEKVAQILLSAYSVDQATTPSAGGLYPLKLYCIIMKQLGVIDPGYYEVSPDSKRLIRLDNTFDTDMVEYCFDMNPPLHGAPFILVIAADFERTCKKYANRGLRYIYLEAGHCAQNVLMAAQDLGIKSLEYGGFNDAAINQTLQMPKGVQPIITIGLGYGQTETLEWEEDRQARELATKLLHPRKGPVTAVYLTQGGDPASSEYFFAATARYKATAHDNARRSANIRYATGTAPTSAMAKIIAIAEAFERFESGDVRVDMVQPATDLAVKWLDPSQVVPYTNEQYHNMPYIKRFAVDQPWEWIMGTELTTKQDIAVPIDLVFFPLDADQLGRPLCYQANSSGIAAHTTYDTAVTSALLELIERDAVMRSWLNHAVPSRVKVSSLPDAWRERCMSWMSQGFEPIIMDLSYGGVAIYLVAFFAPNSYPCLVTGSDASLESDLAALTKAFHEAEVLLRHELKSDRRRRRVHPSQVSNVHDHARLYYYPEHLDRVSWLFDGPLIDLDHLALTDFSSLCKLYSPVCVDLTQPGAPLHVVRVLSKELVPINFGYGTEHFDHKRILNSAVDMNSYIPHYFA